MSNLAKLPLEPDEGLVHVVVETPKGETQKIDYDDELECLVVKRRLPLGVAYPFNFGFFPSTHGEDGDPFDAILLSDQSAFPGLVVPSRVVGVLKVSQTEGRSTVRNDRYVTVADGDVAHAAIKEVGDLGNEIRKEIEAFLLASVELEDKKLKFLGWSGRVEAMKLLRAGVNARPPDPKKARK